MRTQVIDAGGSFPVQAVCTCVCPILEAWRLTRSMCAQPPSITTIPRMVRWQDRVPPHFLRTAPLHRLNWTSTSALSLYQLHKCAPRQLVLRLLNFPPPAVHS